LNRLFLSLLTEALWSQSGIRSRSPDVFRSANQLFCARLIWRL
jgi:hypothetical protein